MLESAIEGALTGAVGAVCGLFIPNPILGVYCATMAGMFVDYTVQRTSQYIENGYYDSSELDVAMIKKTGVLTGAGTAIPQFGQPTISATDAFGTALIWAEGSTLITVADVTVTNINKSTNRNRHSRAALYDEHTLLTT